MYTDFLSSTIPKSQQVETIQMSISCYVDKENVAYLYHVRRNKVLIYVITWVNPENVKQEKPHTIGHEVHDFIYMKYQEYENL